jgi:hypothetical protein
MTDLLNQFINQVATESVNAHVRPEPVQAAMPRRWGLAEHKACIRAWQTIGDPKRVSFEDCKLAVEAFLDSLEAQGRGR